MTAVARSFALSTEPYKHTVYVLEAHHTAGSRWLKRRCKEMIDLSSCAGFTVDPQDDAAAYVWLEPNASLGIISHELIHASMAVLAGSGVPITRANEESLAYLHSHLLEKCVAKLGKQREKAKMAALVAGIKSAQAEPLVDLGSFEAYAALRQESYGLPKT